MTDDLIGLIHRGPLEERPWRSFVRALRRHFDADVAAVALRPGGRGAAPVAIFDRRELQADPVRRRAATDAHRRLAREDPLDHALARHGGILTLSDVMPCETLIKTRFYEEVIRPFGIHHQIGMAVTEPGGWRSHVGMMNAFGHGDFGAPEKALLLSLRPHFQIALETHARLVRIEAERNMFGDALDRMAIAAFVLDGRGRVISTNGAAGRMVQRADQLIVHNGRLSLRDATKNRRLQSALRNAVEWCDGDKAEPFAGVIGVDGGDRNPLGLLVRGVPDGKYQRPGIIVYVGQSKGALVPDALVGELFGLTPAEARIAVLLASGLSLREIADHIGITEKTARSYSKQAYQKTGVSRQADLVRLLLTSVAILGADPREQAPHCSRGMVVR